MIGYTTVGTDHPERAAQFYDTVLAVMGAQRKFEHEDFIIWGVEDPAAPMFSIHRPHDGNAASVGNGTMIGLRATNPEQVAAVHEAALKAGGKNEGSPGIRQEEQGFYAAYFRDLDGNKLNVHCFVQ